MTKHNQVDSWPRPVVSHPSDIVMLEGFALARHIAARQLARYVEVMTAYLDHIERLNPRVNAIVALQDRADLLLQARERDVRLARDELMGSARLSVRGEGPRSRQGHPDDHGLAHPGDFVAPADSVMVERLRKAGAIFIGKTNTPEFGLGSHTYNSVYGATRNAYDPSRSAGGSSGGAAVPRGAANAAEAAATMPAACATRPAGTTCSASARVFRPCSGGRARRLAAGDGRPRADGA